MRAGMVDSVVSQGTEHWSSHAHSLPGGKKLRCGSRAGFDPG